MHLVEYIINTNNHSASKTVFLVVHYWVRIIMNTAHDIKLFNRKGMQPGINFRSNESSQLSSLPLHSFCSHWESCCFGFLVVVPEVATEKKPHQHCLSSICSSDNRSMESVHTSTTLSILALTPRSHNMVGRSESAVGADFSEEAPSTSGSQSRGPVPLWDYADLNSPSANTCGWQGVK